METTWPLRLALLTWIRHRDHARTVRADALYAVLVQAKATVVSGHFTDRRQVDQANELLSALASQIAALRRPETGQRDRISKLQAAWLAAGSSEETVRRHYEVEGDEED